MKQVQKGDNDAIFEMILESVGGNDTAVEAEPSSLVVPEDWSVDHQEGQLAVDVINTKKEIVVLSTIAGANTEKIEVYIHNDLLTIRGERLYPIDKEKITEYFHRECFWGQFSRTVVLPVDVYGDKANAEYRNGVLTIHIPKRSEHAPIPITIVED